LDDLAARNLVRLTEPTPDSVSTSLQALLNDPAAMQDMGRRLQQYVSDHYLWTTQAQRHLYLFRQMISKRVN
jgi:glycosyltransferase involved in cell wall biosynthesis